MSADGCRGRRSELVGKHGWGDAEAQQLVEAVQVHLEVALAGLDEDLNNVHE
jgi:hypothetical protein